MGFHEVQFPQDQAYASEFGAGWRTGVVELDSGSEERTARWDSPRHQYDLAHSIRSIDSLNVVKDFYMARQGAANGFRFKDWTDFTTAANHRDAPTKDDVSIGTGDGAQVTFQIVKKYTSGATVRSRKLQKIVSGTLLVALDGVEQFDFGAPADYSVNVNEGTITFGAAPGAAVDVTCGCEFDVPVRFADDADEAMLLDYENFDQGNYSIPLIELIDELPQPDEFFFGGFKSFSYSVDIRLTVGDGRVIHLLPSIGTPNVILPHAPYLAPGGPYFFLENVGGSVATDLFESGALITDTPTDLSTQLLDTEKAIAVVGKNSSNVNTWYFYQ